MNLNRKGRAALVLALVVVVGMAFRVSWNALRDIAGLSRLAVAKFTCLRRAVDLTYVGGSLLVLAALLSLGGAL